VSNLGGFDDVVELRFIGTLAVLVTLLQADVARAHLQHGLALEHDIDENHDKSPRFDAMSLHLRLV